MIGVTPSKPTDIGAHRAPGQASPVRAGPGWAAKGSRGTDAATFKHSSPSPEPPIGSTARIGAPRRGRAVSAADSGVPCPLRSGAPAHGGGGADTGSTTRRRDTGRLPGPPRRAGGRAGTRPSESNTCHGASGPGATIKSLPRSLPVPSVSFERQPAGLRRSAASVRRVGRCGSRGLRARRASRRHDIYARIKPRPGGQPTQIEKRAWSGRWSTLRDGRPLQ